jgi:hypothetical protein
MDSQKYGRQADRVSFRQAHNRAFFGSSVRLDDCMWQRGGETNVDASISGLGWISEGHWQRYWLDTLPDAKLVEQSDWIIRISGDGR